LVIDEHLLSFLILFEESLLTWLFDEKKVIKLENVCPRSTSILSLQLKSRKICRHSQFNNWWFHVRRMKREIYSAGETRLKVLSSRSWGAQKPSMNQGNFKRKGGSRTLYNFLTFVFSFVI